MEALLSMEECIEAVDGALRSFARGTAFQPLRILEQLPGGRNLLGVMPGGLPPDAADEVGSDELTGGEASGDPGGEDGGGVSPAHLAVKVISVFPGNRDRGEESHHGLVLLLDGATGAPLALMDAEALTATRTAAASAVATRELAVEDASVLAILGSGVQARSHVAAMRAVRPVRDVRVWSRTPAHAARFAETESERHDVPVRAVATAREAVTGAGLVCTVTSSREPVLRGAWLSEGAHVNAVGACVPDARELDTEAVARARVYVDSREAALAEAGDLLIPRAAGAWSRDALRGEVGEVLLGRVPGRESPDDVTVFESLGLAVEDVAAARLVYERAAREDRGRSLPL